MKELRLASCLKESDPEWWSLKQILSYFLRLFLILVKDLSICGLVEKMTSTIYIAH